MSLSLSPSSLSRYYSLVRLFYKYGRGDLVKDIELDGEKPANADHQAPPPKAEELAKDLEKLGPTFVKLGQLLSTRPDIIPTAYEVL